MNALYRWQPSWIIPPVWMARARYSAQRDEILFIAFPLNIPVAFAWWIQDRWARAAHAPSWIDREAEKRRHQPPF